MPIRCTGGPPVLPSRFSPVVLGWNPPKNVKMSVFFLFSKMAVAGSGGGFVGRRPESGEEVAEEAGGEKEEGARGSVFAVEEGGGLRLED